MAPPRPSTSKSQAHLNTGASRSKLVKELNELLEFAKNIKDESVFQQEHRYKRFKANNQTILVHEIRPIWFNFFIELIRLKFYKECIFWSNKILEDVRLCDSPERSLAFYGIVKSFYDLDDYENVFKYGEKYLEINQQTMTSEDRGMRRQLLFFMQLASRKLNRIDEFQYPKEILKLDVLWYNAKEIDEFKLLRSYYNCISMQTEIGNFKGAKKTLKHLKMFSLNSMHSNDAVKAMENEDYGTAFPLNNLLNNSAGKDKKKLASEFCKINSNHDSFQLFEKKVDLYCSIGRICWQKHETLMNLGEIPINFEWGYLALNIFHDISLHLELLMKTSEEIAVEAAKLDNRVMIQTVGFTLLLVDNDQMNRQKLFSQLTKKIYGGNWHTIPISNFILSAQRLFSNLNVQKVMPFLEFCLRSSIRSSTSRELNVFKVQLSTFKNSLTIINHFGALKNTLAFQPVPT